MSVVKALEAQIAEAWADVPELAGVRVLATERLIDRIAKPTLQLRYTSVGKLPEAPNAHRSVGILATLIASTEQLDNAGDELEPILFAALDYFDRAIPHDDATSVAYNNRLAFDIPLRVIATKE